jgi:hypothetical protein
MVYPSYLLCLLLMIPAFALSAIVIAMMLLAAGPKDGWSVIINSFAFFGAGIAEPFRYGWRIVALLMAIGFFLGAGAIPQLRTAAFYGLGVIGSVCVAFCLYAAIQQGSAETFNAIFVLTPSIAGVVACAWFAAKFG